MNKLTFDIETVPLLKEEMTQIQKDELAKRATRLAEQRNMEYAEAEQLTAGTSPFFGEIVCIGLHLVTSNGETDSIALTGLETDQLTRFWKNLAQFKGLFISYNGLAFDVPFILKRSMFHGILPTNRDFLNQRRFSTFPHFDVKEVISSFSFRDSVSLNLATSFLGIPSPKEGEVSAAGVADAYRAGKIDEIAKYCIRDVETTYAVYDKVKNYHA